MSGLSNQKSMDQFNNQDTAVKKKKQKKKQVTDLTAVNESKDYWEAPKNMLLETAAVKAFEQTKVSNITILWFSKEYLFNRNPENQTIFFATDYDCPACNSRHRATITADKVVIRCDKAKVSVYKTEKETLIGVQCPECGKEHITLSYPEWLSMKKVSKFCSNCQEKVNPEIEKLRKKGKGISKKKETSDQLTPGNEPDETEYKIIDFSLPGVDVKRYFSSTDPDNHHFLTSELDLDSVFEHLKEWYAKMLPQLPKAPDEIKVYLKNKEEGQVWGVSSHNNRLNVISHPPTENEKTFIESFKKDNGTRIDESSNDSKKLSQDNSQITLEKFTFVLVNPAKILSGPFQFRIDLDDAHIQTLMDSMKQKREDGSTIGNIEPIIIRPHEDIYHLIAGHHRLEAAKKLKMKSIECKVISCDDAEAFDIAVTTNFARKNMTDYEKAKAIEHSISHFYRPLHLTAEKIGIDKSAASHLLRSVQSDKRIVEMWKNNEISTSHIRSISRLADSDKQFDLAQEVVLRQLSTLSTEARVKELKELQKALETHKYFLRYDSDPKRYILAQSIDLKADSSNTYEKESIIDYIHFLVKEHEDPEIPQYKFEDFYAFDYQSKKILSTVEQELELIATLTKFEEYVKTNVKKLKKLRISWNRACYNLVGDPFDFENCNKKDYYDLEVNDVIKNAGLENLQFNDNFSENECYPDIRDIFKKYDIPVINAADIRYDEVAERTDEGEEAINVTCPHCGIVAPMSKSSPTLLCPKCLKDIPNPTLEKEKITSDEVTVTEKGKVEFSSSAIEKINESLSDDVKLFPEEVEESDEPAQKSAIVYDSDDWQTIAGIHKKAVCEKCGRKATDPDRPILWKHQLSIGYQILCASCINTLDFKDAEFKEDLQLYESLRNNEDFDLNTIMKNLGRYIKKNPKAAVINGHELSRLFIDAIINYGHLSAPKESFIESDAFYALTFEDDGWFNIWHSGKFECRREKIEEIPEALVALSSTYNKKITVDDLVAADEKAEKSLQQLKDQLSKKSQVAEEHDLGKIINSLTQPHKIHNCVMNELDAVGMRQRLYPAYSKKAGKLKDLEELRQYSLDTILKGWNLSVESEAAETAVST